MQYGNGYRIEIARRLSASGWKVRQVAGRRIWYKGRAGAEIVAQGMDAAWNLELTLRRTKTGGFMWGLEIAELLGSVPPAPRPKTAKQSTRQQRAARAALADMQSATFANEGERDLFMDVTTKARKVLEAISK